MKLSGPDSTDAAATMLMLARCAFGTKRAAEGADQLDNALHLLSMNLGKHHPSVLDAKVFQAEVLLRADQDQKAHELLTEVSEATTRLLGPGHETSLERLGALADIKLRTNLDVEAKAIETRIMQIARQLLKGSNGRIEAFKSLRLVTNYMVARPHLQEESDLFLAKAFVTYKERLTHDSLLFVEVHQKILDLIKDATQHATRSLEEAEIYQGEELFQKAEMQFKRAYTFSKLVRPDHNHPELAMGLADAYFGVGKVNEAKAVMRAAGLVKKGMRENMPTSYLRWMNKRVVQYMDARNEDALDEDLS
mmetsp:Transcript_14665/g.42912  ORF Transcript_14665/g.42912 Transcript_14665/m.42912 type:complete len:307 (-) Transcript_14665:784-1704(-)